MPAIDVRNARESTFSGILARPCPASRTLLTPRLKSVLNTRDLALAFTPTADELMRARRTAKGPVAQLGFLVLLKLFQRLGRPVPVAHAPALVVEHVARVAGIYGASSTLEGYDRSGTRRRYLVVIRDQLGVQPFGPAARHALIHALAEAASTKHELEDLINVGIEQLVRQRFELPAFDAESRRSPRSRHTHL